MAYTVKAVTIRTDNSPEGMTRTSEIWQDITTGKLPILFDSIQVLQPGISPVARYSNYASDENGAYDLTIMGVSAAFFQSMEEEVNKGFYKKYEEKDENGNIELCAQKAWSKVWADQKSGDITRTFTNDYESTVPREYTKDGKAHCYLYIAIQKK